MLSHGLIFGKSQGYGVSDKIYLSKEVESTDVPARAARGVVPVAVETTSIQAVVRVAANLQKNQHHTLKPII